MHRPDLESKLHSIEMLAPYKNMIGTFMIKLRKKFEPPLSEPSKKMAGTACANLAPGEDQGKQILYRKAGESPFLAYANRLGDRSIADELAQLWEMRINGEVKLPNDAEQLPSGPTNK